MTLKQMTLTSIQNQMDEWYVRWEFGPQEASHHGGLYSKLVYEWQIRTL